MRKTVPHAAYPFLLATQLRLLEDSRADVAILLEVGERHDEVLVDAIANDLVGARILIRAALAVPFPSGVPRGMRKELQRLEHEAGDLLRLVLVALGGDNRPLREGC